MFRLITTLPLWGLHFTKQMSTSPLAKVNKTLGKFIADRVPVEKYEPQFSAYQSFIEESIFNNKEIDHQKLILLDQVTKIYENYKLPSKKLLKLQNKLSLECFEWATNKGVSEIINVLACVQRYNPRKALALFKMQKQSILKELRSLSSASIMLLLRFLKQERIDEPLVRETAIEMLYSEINMFNQLQLLNLLDCLAWSKKYINKEFLIRLGVRILALYKSGNIEDKYIYNILSHLSEIQVNLHSRSVYVAQFDELYELVFPSVFMNINSISDVQLNRLASAFRRSKYYEEAMIQQLIQTCMTRDIREFNGDRQKSSNLSIQLRTFANIVNTVAVFNFKSIEFKSYTLGILKLLMSSDKIMLPAHIFSRLLWSICVLYERHEVAEIYPLIEGYLDRAAEIPLHQAMNFYYCYLYLRTSHPRIGEKKDKIYKLLEGFHLETKSSNIQNEVHQTLLQIGVPCLSEYNLNNIICDIMIPEWNNIKNAIIQIHGFRHFFRNVKKLTGASALKTKIITSEMYGYYFISADEWMILEDKKTFLKDFIQHINELEGKKRSATVPTTGQSAGRIRGRPRVFRIGS